MRVGGWEEKQPKRGEGDGLHHAINLGKIRTFVEVWFILGLAVKWIYYKITFDL